MELVRTAASFPFAQVAAGSVVTIGAFDGLHLGHRALLDTAVEAARSRAVPVVVMSFEPTPREYFSVGTPPARLMRFREKFEALAEADIDVFFCPRFNGAMREISAATFIRQLLIHTLNAKQVVIGDDFRFARHREGDAQTLSRAARALDFSLVQVPGVLLDGVRVSSTAVREALANGDLAQAARYLGRPYRMSGRVVRGQKLGRELGYPTANVNLQRRQGAVMGIFAVKVRGVTPEPLSAVASVGTRPTFSGTTPVLEVHIFDFDGDLYGRYIHVDFIEKLRAERKFDSADALVEQMNIDSRQAREILAA